MLPILISVSEAPVSYFFCANAPLLVAASNARAAAKAPSRKLITDILISLGSGWMCHLFLIGALGGSWEDIEYLSAPSSNKKPPATASRGAIFSRMPRETARAAEY
jgi:hypothetical protein